MKIGALPEALQLLNLVRERKGGDLPDRRRDGQPPRDPKEGERGEDSPEDAKEKLQNAVAAFAADAQAQANGLSADVVESGKAGLRVVLRDQQGHVLRQLSGDEFLRMRELASAEPSGPRLGRGKILDQKL